MLTHALRALKEAYPDLRVTVATRPVFRAFFTGLDLGFMDVDIKGVHHSLRGMWRLAADARRLGVDAVADVVALPADAIKPAPQFQGQVDSSFVRGIATVGERMLIVVDIESLLSSSEMGLVQSVATA